MAEAHRKGVEYLEGLNLDPSQPVEFTPGKERFVVEPLENDSSRLKVRIRGTISIFPNKEEETRVKETLKRYTKLHLPKRHVLSCQYFGNVRTPRIDIYCKKKPLFGDAKEERIATIHPDHITILAQHKYKNLKLGDFVEYLGSQYFHLGIGD